MLVLQLYRGERIFIGPDIKIQFCEQRGKDRIRLGIEAPKHVRIDREEVRRREQAKAEQ